MPDGVIVEVADGFATLDFVDSALRGPALNQLLAIGGPASIETITRDGPRRKYRVPEGNADEAGLLDGSSSTVQRGDTGHAAALSDAHTENQTNPNRPVQPTSANTFEGDTSVDEARQSTAHVKTTLKDGSGSGELHPPAHKVVQAKVKAAQTNS